jgi:hypothetical protein
VELPQARALKGAFLDELEKIAVSRHRMSVAQSRKGRRPMRVDTMLRKEKEGTLYKKHASYPPFSMGPVEVGDTAAPKRMGDAPSNDATGSDRWRHPPKVIGRSKSFNGAVNAPKTAGVLDSARGALSRGASSVAGAAERKGLGGAATALRAGNAPIETGAMGHVVQDAGQRMQVPSNSHFRQGMGRALQEEGHVLSRGGAPAVVRSVGKVLNPVGAMGEVAAAGAGNMAAKALKYAPGSRGDRILTHHIPKAFEYAAPAAMGMALHAPVGAAGLLGGKGMAAAAGVKPLAAAGHLMHGGLANAVGHGATEFAQHGAADIAGSGAQRLALGAAGRSAGMFGGRLAAGAAA